MFPHTFILSLLSLILIREVEGKSLTFVLDTTFSMNLELDNIRRRLPEFVKNVSPYIEKYVVVPFNDPAMGPVTQTKDPDNFKDIIIDLVPTKGGTCQEDSLSALLEGVKLSERHSHVYLFTDAYPKDDSKTETITRICQQSGVQVEIILSGVCAYQGSTEILYKNITSYQQITRDCSGELVILKQMDTRDILNYVQEIIKWDQTGYLYQNKTPCDGQLHRVHVDNSIAEVLIKVSGDSPYFRVLNYDRSEAPLITLINSMKFKVFQITNPKGDYHIICQSYSNTTTIAIAVKRNIGFQMGFSRRKAATMEETARRPLPNEKSYISIRPLSDDKYHPVTVEITYLRNTRNSVNMTLKKSESTFVSDGFQPKESIFRITIYGYDSKGKNVTKTSPNIEVQTPAKSEGSPMPTVDIIELKSNEVDYGEDRTLACKVTGLPKPVIEWTDEKKSVYKSESELLEYPHVYISYVTIRNITSNMASICKTKNGLATISKSVSFNVRHDFEVIEEPSDLDIEAEEEGILRCKVTAHPAVTTTWYQNNTKIEDGDDYEIQDGGLVINQMRLANVGIYTCKVTNAFEAHEYRATVYIHGLIFPVISGINDKVVVVREGGSLNIPYRVQGKPAPSVKWEFKDIASAVFKDVYYDVTVDEDELSISVIKSKHSGVYRCTATNDVGEVVVIVKVVIQNPPKIEVEPSTVTVRENALVKLHCRVQSEPASNVYWVLKKEGQLIAFDSRHSNDADNTHSFVALWTDSGDYYCVADNKAGKEEKKIVVTVLSAPYIEAFKHKDLLLKSGSEIALRCNLVRGDPVPTVTWEFQPLHSAKVIQMRSSSNYDLVLRDLKDLNSGLYTCKAENKIGYDLIQINLNVV